MWIPQTRVHRHLGKPSRLADEEIKVRSKQGNQHKLPIFFQEPWFIDGDDRLIAALGGQVLWHPEANNVIDTNTFVFAQFLDFSATYEVVFSSDSGVYYGEKAEDFLQPPPAYRIRQHLRGTDQGAECGTGRHNNPPFRA